MERQLSTIQKIYNLHPIEGADDIEVANILGWHVVVKKGEFTVGDYCVYCEVDSLFPDKPQYEFLRSRKFRIRTIKLRKQISQGIAFPIDILKEYNKYWSTSTGFFGNIGDDVTELLEITKYDPQAIQEQTEAIDKIRQPTNKVIKYMMKSNWFRNIYKKIYGKKKEQFPSWLIKTDESRLQGMPGILSKYKDDVFYYSEKLDGQSVSFFIINRSIIKNIFKIFSKNYTFGVCSRNLYMPRYINNNWWNIAKQQNIEQKLKRVKKNVVFKEKLLVKEFKGINTKLKVLTIMYSMYLV